MFTQDINMQNKSSDLNLLNQFPINPLMYNNVTNFLPNFQPDTLNMNQMGLNFNYPVSTLPMNYFPQPKFLPPKPEPVKNSMNVDLSKPLADQRPILRKTRLKRAFEPDRVRNDYSHIKDPKERRRLKSLDNARLHRDRERKRITDMESAIEETNLLNNNLILENSNLKFKFETLKNFLDERNENQALEQTCQMETSNVNNTNDSEGYQPNVNFSEVGEYPTIPDQGQFDVLQQNEFDNNYRADYRENHFSDAVTFEETNSSGSRNKLGLTLNLGTFGCRKILINLLVKKKFF